MYFSNICILGRMENAALRRLAEDVKGFGVNLDARLFGLGQEYYLHRYFKQEPALPDILISTDLEVFENNAVFDGLPDGFIDLTRFFEIKSTVPKNVFWSDKLLPFLIIPMVFFHSGPDAFRGLPPTLENVIKHDIPVTFGGVNNSGAKCVLKSVHDRFGIEACERLARNAVVTDMPIGAFNRARKGESALALVPSVYAMRADQTAFYMTYPADGAIALPSYAAVKRDNAELAVKVLKALLTADFCAQFVTQGALYCGLAGTPDPELLRVNGFDMAYPSAKYVAAPQPDFYRVYERYVKKSGVSPDF
jgi:hypothetical protein